MGTAARLQNLLCRRANLKTPPYTTVPNRQLLLPTHNNRCRHASNASEAETKAVTVCNSSIIQCVEKKCNQIIDKNYEATSQIHLFVTIFCIRCRFLLTKYKISTHFLSKKFYNSAEKRATADFTALNFSSS